VHAIDWTQVLVALVLTIPAIIAAIYARGVHQQVQTPSGATIGRQVEDALHTVLSNNYHLQSIGQKVDAPTLPQANGEACKVEALHEPPPPDKAG
jgi:hypothetical protein